MLDDVVIDAAPVGEGSELPVTEVPLMDSLRLLDTILPPECRAHRLEV